MLSTKLVWGYIALTAITLAFSLLFMRGGFAQEVDRGVVCDTPDQVETVAAFQGEPDVALQWVNTDHPHACGIVLVKFYRGGDIRRIPQGTITKIAVVAYHNGHDWTAAQPTVQYTYFADNTPFMLVQHNHERYHNTYQGWASEVTENCCNLQFCAILTTWKNGNLWLGGRASTKSAHGEISVKKTEP